jgi:hypothetical protein
VFWLFAASASAQTAELSACDAAEFSAEVLNHDATKNLCPKPVDPVLERLFSQIERTQGKDSHVFFAVLRSLRDHCHGTEPSSWRAALAQNIDDVFTRAKALRLPPAHFAAVRDATTELDPESCLFVTGDAGQAGYTCYFMAGTAKPAHPQGPQVAMAAYELSDFADAYLAQRALGIAYGAMLKLEVPALDQALKRLTLANQRWSNLRKRGYLQYPWELAFSSVFSAYNDYQACFASDAYCSGEEGLDPERWRLIALHPGVGMGFSGFGWKQKPSADAALALSLELLGATYYQADFSSYLGASLGALVNDGDFGDVRPGVFVHVTRWLHVGYLLSLFQRDTRYDATLFLSTDLGTALGVDFLD